MPKGGKQPGAGRPFGAKGKNKAAIKDLLSGIVEKGKTYVDQVLDGQVPCGVCRGKGKTRYQAAHSNDKTFERTCMSCYGSGFERLSPDTRLRAALDAINYGHAKIQAVQHSITADAAETLVAVLTARENRWNKPE